MLKKKGLARLSEASGISIKTMKEIWTEVKKNQALLNSCSFHEFEFHPDPNMSRRFLCKNCKGVVDAVRKSWYEKGLAHNSELHQNSSGKY